MPNVYLPDSTFEQWRAAGERAGFDMSRRGPGGESVKFARQLLDDAEHYRRVVGEWNALVEGLQGLGFRVWSGSDDPDGSWSYQWDGGKRTGGFASDVEAMIAAVKAKLHQRAR
jgi:hypothetical protein